MISAKQYTDTYNQWKEQLRKANVAIENSTECRKYLIKNSAAASYKEMLVQAVKCIADLTGDECFRKEVIRNLERRNDEND